MQQHPSDEPSLRSIRFEFEASNMIHSSRLMSSISVYLQVFVVSNRLTPALNLIIRPYAAGRVLASGELAQVGRDHSHYTHTGIK